MATVQKEYSKEFIQETLDLLRQGHKPPAYIAWKRGIPLTVIHDWLKQVNNRAKKDSASKISAHLDTGGTGSL